MLFYAFSLCSFFVSEWRCAWVRREPLDTNNKRGTKQRLVKKTASRYLIIKHNIRFLVFG